MSSRAVPHAAARWARRCVLSLSPARLLGPALLLGPLLLTSACLESQCDRHNGDPVEYRGGNTLGDGQYYETGSLEDPFLYFPAGRSYELVHGLRQAPSEMHAYLAFAECPLSKSVRTPGRKPRCEPVDAASGGGGFSESAGNEALFEVRDDRVILVRNDTCAEFYLRVVATTSPTEAAAASDAGTP